MVNTVSCKQCGKTLDPVAAAKAEVEHDQFRELVEKEKEKIRSRKNFWDFIPFKIVRK